MSIPTYYKPDPGATIAAYVIFVLVGLPICLLLLMVPVMLIAETFQSEGARHLAQGIGWLLWPWFWTYQQLLG